LTSDKPKAEEKRIAIAAPACPENKSTCIPCAKIAENGSLTKTHGNEVSEGLLFSDPRIPMDNNRSQRKVRGPAVGRNNDYGSASQWSGRLAAMRFSIFATLDLWKLNPRRWRMWFLEACAAAGSRAPSDISGFVPWN
jgi:hypothetical protein